MVSSIRLDADAQKAINAFKKNQKLRNVSTAIKVAVELAEKYIVTEQEDREALSNRVRTLEYLHGQDLNYLIKTMGKVQALEKFVAVLFNLHKEELEELKKIPLKGVVTPRQELKGTIEPKNKKGE